MGQPSAKSRKHLKVSNLEMMIGSQDSSGRSQIPATSGNSFNLQQKAIVPMEECSELCAGQMTATILLADRGFRPGESAA